MVGETIKKYRIKKGLSLSKLAELADVEKSYLSSIERKIYFHPSMQFLEKISPVLGISTDALLTECSPQAVDPVWNDIVTEALETGLTTEEYLDFLKSARKQNSEGNRPKTPISHYFKTYLGNQKQGVS